MISLNTLPWRPIGKMVHVEDDEILLITFDTHWIKFVSPTLIIVVLLLVVGSALYASFFLFPVGVLRTLSFVFGQSVLLITFHWMFYNLLNESLQDIVITNKRFIFLETKLWVEDNMHEIRMDRIRAVDVYKNGVLQNLLNYGSLWFDIGDSSAEFNTIKLVPHPHTVAEIISQYIVK